MPKGPRKFHFSFEKSDLTRFGGLSLFQSFCNSLGLRHFLQLYVRDDRGFQELLLRGFKGSYAMAKIPRRSFWANTAYTETILWAYDLVLAFQFLCLPEEVRHWNIATLRRELWWLPADWIRRDNRNLLMLPSRYPRQNLFFKMQHATTA